MDTTTTAPSTAKGLIVSVEDRLSDGVYVTLSAKFTQAESDKLDALVKKFSDDGKLATRSSLIRAIVGEYLDVQDDLKDPSIFIS